MVENTIRSVIRGKLEASLLAALSAVNVIHRILEDGAASRNEFSAPVERGRKGHRLQGSDAALEDRKRTVQEGKSKNSFTNLHAKKVPLC